MSDQVISFLRKREYKYIKELGQGGCGKTVLLLDDVIDEHFVCKKFAPTDSGMKQALYTGFMNEIKLMHNVFHLNVVRIFGYYTFPREFAGFILMEYVEGETIDKFIRAAPESFGAVFRQTIEAFCHLQECRILHRDIRFGNILVRNDGLVKVIDLGFGKKVEDGGDFAKSITLNWAFATPNEFGQGKYDFRTEVYFIGKLFEHIMEETGGGDARLKEILRKMCEPEPRRRIGGFAAVKLLLDQADLSEPEFAEEDVETYRCFADELVVGLAKIDVKCTNVTDVAQVIARLEVLYESSMLERAVGANKVARCFLSGTFHHFREQEVTVSYLRAFLKLLKCSDVESQRIILANLFARLDGVKRFDDDEIPF